MKFVLETRKQTQKAKKKTTSYCISHEYIEEGREEKIEDQYRPNQRLLWKCLEIKTLLVRVVHRVPTRHAIIAIA